MGNINAINNKVPSTGSQPLLVGNLDASVASAVDCISATTATTNSYLTPSAFSAACSGAPGPEFGQGLDFQMHTSNNTMAQSGYLQSIWLSATNGAQTAYLDFSTVTAGSALYAEVFQAYSTGLTTNGTGSDPFQYSTGTFTPTVEGTTVAGTANYTYAKGAYVKFGNICFFTFCVSYDTLTGTGNLRGSGLPFNSEALTNEFWQLNVWASNLVWTANTYLQTYPGIINSNKVTFNRIASAAGANIVSVDAAAQIIVSGYYKTT